MWVAAKGASDLVTPFGSMKKIFANIRDSKGRTFWLKRYYSILKLSNRIIWILGRVRRQEFFVFPLHMYVLSSKETQK